MRRIPFTGKKTGLPHVRFEMTEDTYRALDNDYSGLCIRCGDEQGGCEPDARRYKCESCQNLSVYGIQELIVMGWISISDSDDESNEESA